ncbi:IS4/IS5 family transposase, partial [Streptomyces sp. PSKA54]|nr:IS4/IS5 family transposase [Streptomyces himalayensis subsp. aureolus]
MTYGDNSITGSYRLVTTLTDARRYPAPALVALYHQRWEHESAYYALRHTIMDGRVLRSGDPVGVEQEMWALLALYQALRTVMVEATESQPGTDPDRCGFTIAIQTARDLVVQAADVIKPDAPGTGTTGVIGNRVLAGLLPHRRPRISTRKVRSPVSRYAERQDDGRPDTSLPVTGLDVAILEPEADLPTISHDDRYTPPADRRRQRVLDLLHAEPDRHWHTRDLARHLGDITLSTMYRQLDRWAAHGLITKTGPATYSSSRTCSTPLP